jgi:hypoxanthine-guanine phosphoribosyltransferase
MNDSDHRDEIVRLEAQIDELAARIESCRKFILVGRIAVMGGGAVLITMLVSAIQFDPSVMALAVAAVLGGTSLQARTAVRRKKRCMN